jgi:hypothetical protein
MIKVKLWGKLNETCRVKSRKGGKRHRERIEKKLRKIDEFLRIMDKEEGGPGDKSGKGGHPIQSNITDNESAKIKGPHGVIQGYNGIAVADCKNQVIVAAEAFGTGPEAETFPLMLDKLNEAMREITGKEEPLKDALVTADTGYFSEDNLQAAAEREIEVLIPDQQFRKRDEQFAEQRNHKHGTYYSIEDFEYDDEEDRYICPNGKTLKRKPDTKLRGKPMLKWQALVSDCKICPLKDKCMKVRGNKRGSKKTILLLDRKGKENLSLKMRDKIDNPIYRQVYGQRMRIIEPCFSNITYCKGMDRFLYRGKEKNNAQWLLFVTVHNIGKCVPFMTRRRRKKK